MAEILDDKSEHCIPFIVEQIKLHQEKFKSLGQAAPPFFLGLNGVQGAGKTSLVSTLCNTLSSEPYNLPTVVLSIDDLYLPHEQQVALAKSQADNSLVQHRGQPSTHDIKLGTELFAALRNRQSNIRIPSYDKSAFQGQGDRRDPSKWEAVNHDSAAPKVEVIVFEGWCVGFRPVDPQGVSQKWQEAKAAADQAVKQSSPAYDGQLGKVPLESALFVNDALRSYNELTDQLDAFIHIDAQDPLSVYKWRLQQEAMLRKEKGTGMTDEQVVAFVNGYYPAYELYTEVLRKGIFAQSGNQLRLVVNQDRKVVDVRRL